MRIPWTDPIHRDDRSRVISEWDHAADAIDRQRQVGDLSNSVNTVHTHRARS